MKISQTMIGTIDANEQMATKRADECAVKAAEYRQAAEKFEEAAMAARQDAEVWRKIRAEYADEPDQPDDEQPVEEVSVEQPRPGWCACGLPGVPGVAHAIQQCTPHAGDSEMGVVRRMPYEEPSPTTVLPAVDDEMVEAL